MICHSETQHILSVAVPLSILSASFFGSGHCAGMCGGLAATMGRTKLAATMYHSGRIVAYTAAGALAGHIGETVFFSQDLSQTLTWVTAFVFAISLIYMGTQIWRGQAPHLPGTTYMSRLFTRSMILTKLRGSGQFVSQFMAGVFTLLLPCGWLYGFIAGAAATGSPKAGALFMFLFSLGTIPALIATTMGLQKGFLNRLRSPRFSGAIFVALGFLTLWLRVTALPQ